VGGLGGRRWLELDGLALNATDLKSWGNYLSSLSVHAPACHLDLWERSMDDLILEVAIWQDGDWVDRSALGERSEGAAKGCSAQP